MMTRSSCFNTEVVGIVQVHSQSENQFLCARICKFLFAGIGNVKIWDGRDRIQIRFENTRQAHDGGVVVKRVIDHARLNHPVNSREPTETV